MFSENILKIRALIFAAFAVFVYPSVLFFSMVYLIWKSISKTRKCIVGEVALVTGGGNGLGKEIAVRLADKGCHIAIVDINEEAAVATAKLIAETYNVKSKAFKVDITEYDEVKNLSREVEKSLGAVTILVNNAGIMTFSSFENPEPSEIQRMINTNITAQIWTVRVFMDKMRELGKGHIVAICSVAGVLPCPRQLEYTTTKFGVHGFMYALRTELFALNCEFIKTTTVFPFFLTTNAKVKGIIQNSGINNWYPSISGTKAAEAVVEGIVTNATEVFIPGVFALFYRLMEMLPKDWQTFILNFAIGRDMANKIKY